MALLPYLVVTPLASAFLTALLGRRVKAAGDVLANFSALILTVISGIVAVSVLGGRSLVYAVGNWMPPLGIPMVVDGLAAFMLVIVNGVAFLVLLFAVNYTETYTDKWKFYTLFSLMLAGINGVLITGDIFNLYVFFEIASVSAYLLVAFGVEPEELEASFKYAVMGAVSSIFILLGIAFLYGYTSTLNLAGMAGILSGGGSLRVVQFVSVLFIMGFGLKAALVPFHAWLPYAHSAAPAPVSAMLSGVLIKVLGIYALSRVFFNVFGVSPAVLSVLITLAVISMIVGAVLAFGQTDIKRLFAYSSISQIGYIVLGLAIATPLSIFAALFHLFNHSVAKSLLFLSSGAIERVTGTRDLTKMSGVLKEAPVTGWASLAAAFSICGIPPLGGFWSKLLIILACVQAQRPWVAFIAVMVSILTLTYYFKALTSAFFGERKATGPGVAGRKVSYLMEAAMIMLAVLCVGGSLMLFPTVANSLLRNATAVLANAKGYAAIFAGVPK